jgi:hypothetical protein
LKNNLKNKNYETKHLIQIFAPRVRNRPVFLRRGRQQTGREIFGKSEGKNYRRKKRSG